MSFKIINNLGKNKIIQSPDILYSYFEKYKKEVKSNPFYVTDWVGGMAKEVVRRKEKPLTMEGFENFCFKNNFAKDLKQYFANTESRYEEYVPICKIIRNEIRQDQIEGGMAGMYNPSITQRLNSLVEKTQTEVIEQPLFPNE